jgi:hypothetical protein
MDPGAHGADHAGKIPPQHVGKLRRPVGLAGTHLPVGAVDAGGKHVDDDLAGLGDRVRHVAIGEDFGPAMLVDVNGFHRVFPAKVGAGYVKRRCTHPRERTL